MADSDSGIDTQYSSDMESVTSTNYNFRTHNGRRYHGMSNDLYFHPCDDDEKNRLDAMQYIFRCLFGGNVIAHINKKPTMILDIGAWAIEVADEFPTARVIGMDLAPIQPHNIPLNCEFRAGDLREDLDDFNEGSIDFVHSRLVHSGFRTDEWPRYITSMFRILKPGNGWAQVVEINGHFFEDNNIPTDCALPKFLEYVITMYESRNTPYQSVEDTTRLFANAGFVEISVVEKFLDIGNWRGDPKMAMADRIARDVFGDAVSVLVENMREIIPDNAERKVFSQKATEEFKSGKHHFSFGFHMVTGRKPKIDI